MPAPINLFVLLAASALVIVPYPVHACFCDKDTLATEIKARPKVAAVVRGRVVDPTPSSDEETITRLSPAIERSEATPGQFDELADAQDRVHNTGQAIDVMKLKIARFGEDAATHARLATFHAMDGNLGGARTHIDKASALPASDMAAQIRVEETVIRYLERLKGDPNLAGREDLLGLARITVAERVPKRPKIRGPAEELAAMLVNGWGRNPHVWFALGRTLAHEGDNQLALRAFHRAVYLGHPLSSVAFCDTAKRFADHGSSSFHCPSVAKTLEAEWKDNAMSRLRHTPGR